METLAYLHLAVAYEAPKNATNIDRLDSEWLKPQKLTRHARIYLLSLVAILGILGMAGEVLAQTVKLGDRSPQVRFIQQRLRQLRYLNQSADGVFGSATRDAVIRFQQDSGLNPDGVVGSETESALFAEFSQGRRVVSQNLGIPGRVLQRGDRGQTVSDVQQRLRELGYFNGQITGVFGSATQEAVSRFQVANNLAPDGIVGSQTRAALFGTTTSQYYSDNSLTIPPPPPLSGDFSGDFSEDFSDERLNQSASTRILRFGDRGTDVRELQQELRQRGFNPGPIDGVYGSQTAIAVRQFQRAKGLFSDGIAGQETLTALGLIDESRRDRYIVVVPLSDQNTLDQVRAVVGFRNASVADSKLGRFVNAGAFPSRALAESRSYLLRSRGLDARVAYR